VAYISLFYATFAELLVLRLLAAVATTPDVAANVSPVHTPKLSSDDVQAPLQAHSSLALQTCIDELFPPAGNTPGFWQLRHNLLINLYFHLLINTLSSWQDYLNVHRVSLNIRP